MIKRKSVAIRFDEEQLDKLRFVAKYDGRSINGEVLHLVDEKIRRFEREIGLIDLEEARKMRPENER